MEISSNAVLNTITQKLAEQILQNVILEIQTRNMQTNLEAAYQQIADLQQNLQQEDE